jgi:hypothetical protein
MINVITPLNFAVQDVYSIDELLAYPIMGVSQMAGKLNVIRSVLDF